MIKNIVALAVVGFMYPIWAQAELNIVISPEQPNSNDRIMVSVENSACMPGGVRTDLEKRKIEIDLGGSVSHIEKCLADNPDAPDFRKTLGPFESGDYSVVVFQYLGGLAIRLADSQVVTIAPAPPGLPNGGINGLYYDPEADGHYVNVLQFDYGTLILWTTFDAQGHQVLVYAVGDLNADRSQVIDAEAWINTGGSVSLSGELTPAQDEHWGRLSIEMTDCHGGVLRFDSDRADFGSGTMALHRLANVKQIGCFYAEPGG